jgi:hypothetical protein
MGRKSSSLADTFVLGMGQIHATFQAAGNDRRPMQELMMFANGGARSSATILTSLAGI